jgi:small-conductance mechanosensitive channel
MNIQTIQIDSEWLESWVYSGFIKDIIEIGGYISIGELQIPVVGLFLGIATLILTYLIFKLLIRVFIKKMELKNASANIINSVKFVLRFVMVFFMIYFIIGFLNIETRYILIVIGIFTTAIAFASIKSINNFIAGIWLTIAQPFSIGDYVLIANVEGIVTELSLNYIRIEERNGNISLIPNINCLNSNIVNYTISINTLKDTIDILDKKTQSAVNRSDKAMEIQLRSELNYYLEIYVKLIDLRREFKKVLESSSMKASKYIKSDKIVQYTLMLELPRTPKRNDAVLDLVCKKWEPIFLIRPNYEISGISAFVLYQITIYTFDPEDIVEFVDEFIKDVYKNLF